MPLVPAIHPLPFFPSPSTIIRMVAKKPDSFFLDSASLNHAGGLFSYVGITPLMKLEGNDNPWSKLAEVLPKNQGSWVGYLAYENYQYLEDQKKNEKLPGPIPTYWFGCYDPILVLDHKKEKAFLKSWRLSAKALKNEVERWIELIGPPSLEGRELEGGWSRGFLIPPIEPYIQKILKIKEYLKAGDVYQINYTERFEADSNLPADLLYQRLRRISPAPYSAFLNAGSFQILSASPELLLQVDQKNILTKPIKGTSKKEDDPLALLASAKDRAELLMIVDLERNDLGKICDYGSISAKPIFSVESFAQVHHLVATVQGRLKNNVTPLEALKQIFPGGSITGAPKRRAIQIIDELEKKPRSVYTGALGLIEPDGKAMFNMPIRTLTKVGKKVYFHAGGGITIDSDPEKEYAEMMMKVEGILRALNC